MKLSEFNLLPSQVLNAVCSLAVFFWGLGCNEVKVRDGGKADFTLEAPQDGADQNENVDPPNNIAGASLHCAEEPELGSSELEALIGCRFDNAKGERVAVNTIAATSEFAFRAPPIPTLKIYSRALNGDSRYDAMYLFVADTKEVLQQGVKDTRILVKLNNVNGQAASANVSGLVRDVQIDVNAIPEPRQTDYSQVRDDLRSDGASDELPPPP